MLRDARKRDYVRSRQPEGKRQRAWDDAGKIVSETEEVNAKKKESLEREERDGVYDSAMERAHQMVRDNGEIKSMVI